MDRHRFIIRDTLTPIQHQRSTNIHTSSPTQIHRQLFTIRDTLIHIHQHRFNIIDRLSQIHHQLFTSFADALMRDHSSIDTDSPTYVFSVRHSSSQIHEHQYIDIDSVSVSHQHPFTNASTYIQRH